MKMLALADGRRLAGRIARIGQTHNSTFSGFRGEQPCWGLNNSGCSRTPIRICLISLPNDYELAASFHIERNELAGSLSCIPVNSIASY
jgi:hypothetical protein